MIIDKGRELAVRLSDLREERLIKGVSYIRVTVSGIDTAGKFDYEMDNRLFFKVSNYGGSAFRSFDKYEYQGPLESPYFIKDDDISRSMISKFSNINSIPNMDIPKDDTLLKDWTTACAIIHLICAFTAMTLYFTIDSFKNYDIQTTLVKTSRNEYDIYKFFKFNITLASSVFALLSSIFHFISLGFWDQYKEMILGTSFDSVTKKYVQTGCGVNVYRWIEYSLSASLMSVIIAAICRVTDFSVLLLIFSATALTMVFGIPLELLRHSKYYTLILILSWTYYTLSSSTLFITVLMYSPLSEVPTIAWVVLITLTLLFNVFGAWQISLSYIDDKFTIFDYELGYCALSAIAKVTLFALVLWGGATDSNWLDKTPTCVFNNSTLK